MGKAGVLTFLRLGAMFKMLFELPSGQRSGLETQSLGRREAYMGWGCNRNSSTEFLVQQRELHRVFQKNNQNGLWEAPPTLWTTGSFHGRFQAWTATRLRA